MSEDKEWGHDFEEREPVLVVCFVLGVWPERRGVVS